MMSNPKPPIFDSVAARLLGCAAAAGRLLPQQCALCAAPCGTALLCQACDHALPRLGAACPRCALPLPGAAVCGRCLARPPPWDAAQAAFTYAYPVDRLVQAMKYQGAFACADFFAAALARMITERVDVVTALPLSASRQRVRGFNQAQEVARRLARALDLPLASVLARCRDTPAQASLPWRERHRNMRHAFAARSTVEGLRVALVDDVLTTGATLSAAATALRRAGARGTVAWVVARTLPPSSVP